MRVLKASDSDFQNQLAAVLSSRMKNNDDLSKTVAAIISRVKNQGDAAVFEYTRQFDNWQISEENLRVNHGEIESAYKNCAPELVEALRVAAVRIKNYSEKQLPADLEYIDDCGVTLGHRWSAIESVGIYVPGGTAAYPSSVLMNAIPAIVAGCKRIAMTVPCPQGEINQAVLAAAHIAGISEIYKIGGAQAIAALAYGTESISKVDKIAGPGNEYVAEAKRQVFGAVGVDMIAGPSEILIIADKNNNPAWIAADLLSQAEHDKMAQSILITDDEDFAEKILAEIKTALSKLPRAQIANYSLENHGAIILVDDVRACSESFQDSAKTAVFENRNANVRKSTCVTEAQKIDVCSESSKDYEQALKQQAAAICNIIAPEHLQLMVDKPSELLSFIKNAGAIFLGRYSPEAIGDYIAGPSHVLPTSGTARFSSGLSVFDFLKRSSIIGSSKSAHEKLGKYGKIIAEAEALIAHKNSFALRE